VYIARNRSIKADVSLYTGGRIAKEKALLDSGATENLILSLTGCGVSSIVQETPGRTA
jgi:hypothetical protein